MYKLLVVDDEYYVRKRVRNCIEWSHFDFDEIFEAADGAEACEIMSCNTINVVIADISMPQLNGLEFIKKIKEMDHNYFKDEPKIIILTGYDYFSYAQTALNLGVNNFILKPIDSIKMYEIIEKLMIQIKEEEVNKMQLVTLQKMKKDEKLLYLFMNLFQEDSGENLLNLFNITEQDECIMVMTRIYNRNEEKNDEDLLDEFIIENILEELLSQKFDVIKFEDAWKQRGFILKCRKEDEKKIDQVIQDSLELISRKSKILVVAAISEVFYGKCFSMKEAYMNINTMLFYSKPNAENINHIVYTKNMNESEVNIEKYLVMVEESLAKFDVAQMQSSLEQIFEDIEKQRCKIEILELIINYIVIKFYAFAEKYMKEQDFVNSKAHIKNIQIQLGNVKTVQYIKQDLQEVFSLIAQKIKEKQTVSGEQIKNKTINYIHRNYNNQDLNLKMIADEIFLNANYLSTTFKRYQGSSIIEYINHIRLEKAKKLLEETDESIQLIAEKVGYTDQFYFSKKFKKEYTFSPQSFRYAYQKNKSEDIPY